MIALVASLRQELAGLHRRLTVGPSVIDNGAEFSEAMAGTRDLMLVRTGVGRQCVERAVDVMLRKFQVDVIVNIGFCGALQKDLMSGDLIMCEEHIRCNSDEIVKPDSHLLSRFSRSVSGCIRIKRGKCLTVDQPAESREKKAQLGHRWNAQIVDMESFWIGRRVVDSGIPFIAFRSVLDEMSVDISSIGSMIDPVCGQPVFLRIFKHLEILRVLPRLFAGMRVAQRSLWGFFDFFLEILD